MSSRPLVIYHQHCLDGFGAAWAFYRRYGAAADYVPGVYQTPPPSVAGREVYLVDFSYSRAQVEAFIREATAVVLLDHHRTALEALAGLPGLQWQADLARSGAALAWDFLYPETPLPPLLAHIQDQDLWRFQLEGTREILAGLASRPWDFAEWSRLIHAGDAAMELLFDDGVPLLRQRRQQVEAIVGECRRAMGIGGCVVPVANAPRDLAGDVANRLAVDAPFAAAYWDTATTRTFSLRATAQGQEVDGLARCYGGGGHPRAAGFSVPRHHPLARE